MTLEQRLENRRIIDPITNCWLWRGSKDKDGYGIITVDYVEKRVHRVAYTFYIGEPINNVLHKLECHNKHCFNPEHLYDGTAADNVNDTLISGNNYNHSKTHCSSGHEYNAENTYYWKTRRYCLQCRKDDYERRRLGIK